LDLSVTDVINIFAEIVVAKLCSLARLHSLANFSVGKQKSSGAKSVEYGKLMGTAIQFWVGKSFCLLLCEQIHSHTKVDSILNVASNASFVLSESFSIPR
jgi:hypothetical protein